MTRARGGFGTGDARFLPSGRQAVGTARSATDPSSIRSPGQVLFVGDFAAAREVASLLEPDGVTSLVTTDGHDALARMSQLAPDVVVFGRGAVDDDTDNEVVRRVGDLVGKPPGIVVVAHPRRNGESFDPKDSAEPSAASDDPRERSGDYLPADVGVDELAHCVRSKLDTSAASGSPRRRGISWARLTEETTRELHRSVVAQRPGVLAAVDVAERDELRRRLGAKGETALVEALEELFAEDAHVLEQHAVQGDSVILLLMPETTVAAGRERLRRLSARMGDAVIDVAGERVRITPVIGYARFSAAETSVQLRQQVSLALHDAHQHLDLLPVLYSPAMSVRPAPPIAARDRVLELVDRLRSPMQIAFTVAVLLSLPFIVYVLTSYAGFDLTTVTYPLVAAALAITAAVMWIECFRAAGAVAVPPVPKERFPLATAVVAAYLPNEAATIVETVTNLLAQDYPGELQIILAYNSPHSLPVEDTLAQIARDDPRLMLLKVKASTSKAQNVNAALAHVRGEFVGIFDADHHPDLGSFARAWRWISDGNDIVQGHCVVRNGDASWVSRLVAVEFEAIYAVSHPGRARLHGFGIFGGSNGYWRTESLRQIRMHGSMLTEDIDSSMRSLLDGFSIVSDPGLLSTELAPTSVRALWNQRMRWAQGWTQTALRHLRPALTSPLLTRRQKIGAGFLLGWTQAVPWVTVQVVPILAFAAWREGGFGAFQLIPLFVMLTIFTLSVSIAQTVFAYNLGDARIRRHRWWFALYALNTMLWFGEFKNVISRVAQLKELIGESQWRVTPRGVPVEVPGAIGEQSRRAPLRDRLVS